METEDSKLVLILVVSLALSIHFLESLLHFMFLFQIPRPTQSSFAIVVP